MIGIDILSGFLGSGKTTFANILLKHYLSMGERPVYIVNEFGNTGLDAQIAESNGFSSVELPNGCVCCTLKYDVVVAIKEIIQTFSPTKIVFEPSGIFVFDNFSDILKDEFVGRNCVINTAITIVDSVTFHKASAAVIAGSFIENQIKSADTLIISKLEKFKGDLSDLVCDVVNINSKALMIAKPFDELDTTDLENIIQSRVVSKQSRPAIGHKKLNTYTINLKQDFHESTLNQFVQKVIGGGFGRVYRVKGTVKMDDTSYLLNIAFNDVNLSEQSFTSETKLTFIGPVLNVAEIKRL